MSKYASRICKMCIAPMIHNGQRNSDHVLKINSKLNSLTAIREMSIRGKY